MFHLIALSLLPILNNSKFDNPAKRVIVEVRIDSVLIEKRYFNSKKLLTDLVIYGNDSGIKATDSLRLLYSLKGKLANIQHYARSNKTYEVVTNSSLLTSIKNSLSVKEDCDTSVRKQNHWYFVDELSDLCKIIPSFFADGREARQKQSIKQKGNNTIVTIDSINGSFSGLSMEVESFFLNRKLLKLKIEKSSKYLIQEELVFMEGRLIVDYMYEKDRIKKILFKAIYNDGTSKKMEKKYSYKAN